MSFAQLNLHPSIAKAIAVCGYTQPTPIQASSIPVILEGKDIVASAQTGSGKTAAFVLPALHHLSQQKPSKQTRILILTPTRELASQITKAASLYGKFLNFNIVSLVGGMPYHHQIKDLMRGANVIVATPGRLMDHIEQGRVDLSHVEMLVLDEADRMLDMGFIDDVQHIAKLTPEHRQTLLFSATVDNKLTGIVRHLLKNPVRIDLSAKTLTAPQIEQILYRATGPQHKTRMLKQLLREAQIYKAIIFSATKINADKLATQLCDEGFEAAALHGDLKQNVRNRTIEKLRRGKVQYLVATDVAARGIDISDITHVINYDMPRFCEDYVHRIGRTGRAGKTGIAISFVLSTDTRHLQRIERYIGQRLKLTQLALGEDTGTGAPFAGEVRKEREPVARFSERDNDFHTGRRRYADSRKPREDRPSFEGKDKRKRDNDSRFVRGSEERRKPAEDRPAFEGKSKYKRDNDSRFVRGTEERRKPAEDRPTFEGKSKYKRDNDSRFVRGHEEKRKVAEDRSAFEGKSKHKRDNDGRFVRPSEEKRNTGDEKFGFAPRKRAKPAADAQGRFGKRNEKKENAFSKEKFFKKRSAAKKSA